MPLDCHRALGWAPCVTQQIPTGYLFYIWSCTCFNASLSICPNLSFPCCVHSLFSMSESLFLPCKQIPQYHFSRFHIYALIYLFFSFWLTSLCITGSRFSHLIRSDSRYVLWLSRNLVLTVEWGVGCYWHLVRRGLGCCRASYSVWNNPLHQGIVWPNKSVVLRWSVLDGLLRNVKAFRKEW